MSQERRAVVLLILALVATACRSDAPRPTPARGNAAPSATEAAAGDPRARAVCDGWEALAKRCPNLDLGEPRELCLRTYATAFADSGEKPTAEQIERCVLGGGECAAVATCLDAGSPSGLYSVTSFAIGADCVSRGPAPPSHPMIGKPASLDAVTALRGTPVLVAFTGSWESTFRHQLPLLAKVQDARVVLVLSDAPEDVASLKLPPSLTVVVDKPADGSLGPITKQWGISAVPESFLVDATGVVRRYYVRAHDWSSADAAACFGSITK